MLLLKKLTFKNNEHVWLTPSSTEKADKETKVDDGDPDG